MEEEGTVMCGGCECQEDKETHLSKNLKPEGLSGSIHTACYLVHSGVINANLRPVCVYVWAFCQPDLT